MLHKWFLLIFLTNFSFAVHLKLSDYCWSTEVDCKGHYNSNKEYKVVCENLCEAKYSTHCGAKMCSKSQQACENHQQLVKSLNPFFKTVYDELSQKLFIIFQRNVKKCPIRTNWRSNDICLNIGQCLASNASQAVIQNSIQTKSKCQCPRSHSFHCEENFCSVNSFACNGFKVKHKYNPKNKLFGYKYCRFEYIS